MNSPFTLDDVLEAIMVEEENPSYEVMCRWIERYPEHRVPLIRFFGTWTIQSEQPEQPEESASANAENLAARGVSYALNLLNQREARSLLDRAQSIGISLEKLAATTRLDDSILQKMNRRLITNIPQECIRLLAQVLASTLEDVRGLISGPPMVVAGIRHKAKAKPAVTTEDFITAVKHSSLPADVKREWLKIGLTEQSDLSEH